MKWIADNINNNYTAAAENHDAYSAAKLLDKFSIPR